MMTKIFCLLFLVGSLCDAQSDLKIKYDLRDKMELDIRDYRNGYGIFSKDGKDGIIDSTGTIVLQPIKGTLVSLGENNLYIHYLDEKKSRKTGIINSIGVYIIPLDEHHFVNYWNGANQALVTYKNKKHGLYNLKGELVLPFEYDDIREAHEGMYFLQQNKKYALYDVKKGIISDFIYEEHGYFENGMASVKVAENQYQLIDKNNKLLLTTNDEIINLKNYPYLTTLNRNNNKEGLIDASGKELLPLEYSNIFIKENYAVLEKRNEKEKYLYSLEEKWIRKIDGDYIQHFRKNLFVLGKNDKQAIIDDDGKVVFPYNDRISLIFNDNKDFVLIENNEKQGLLNEKFEEVLAVDYQFLAYDNQRIIAKNENKFVEISWKDFQINELLGYEEIQPIININYYDLPRDTKLIPLKIKKNNKFGIMFVNGEEIIAPIYDEIKNLHRGNIFIVKKEGKWGLMNYDNEIIRPFVYDSYGVSKEYMYFLKDKKKEIISLF